MQAQDFPLRMRSRRGTAPIGDDLFVMRLEAGMSQEDLARKSGVSQGVISNIETGKRAPMWETLCRLVAGLGGRIEIIDSRGERSLMS